MNFCIYIHIRMFLSLIFAYIGSNEMCPVTECLLTVVCKHISKFCSFNIIPRQFHIVTQLVDI